MVDDVTNPLGRVGTLYSRIPGTLYTRIGGSLYSRAGGTLYPNAIMKGIRQYLLEIQYLLGPDKNKIPFLIIFFLAISLLDLAGLGLIMPYISLVIDPNSFLESPFNSVLEHIFETDEYFL